MTQAIASPAVHDLIGIGFGRVLPRFTTALRAVR